MRWYAQEMDEILHPFCRKEVHSTAGKYASQYVYNRLWMQHRRIRSTLMMIDMNGPDIEAVDEVK